MVNTTEDKPDTQRKVEVALPVRLFGFAHQRNIEYVIEQLNIHSDDVPNPVVLYWIQRSTRGNREIGYQIVSREKAEEIRRKNPNRFDYYTLDYLLRKIDEIKEGKYKIEGGLIVGLNPSYSRKTRRSR